jgi:hypothetical protein
MRNVSTLKKVGMTLAILLAIALIVLACVQDTLPKKEREFVERVQIPVESLNEYVSLSLPASGNSFIFGDPILLNLVNRTFATLTFPADYGASIFIYDEVNKYWLEVDNLTVYAHSGNRQISPIGKESTGEVTFLVYPDAQGIEQPVVVRVLVVGSMKQSDTPINMPVGAYIDIPLSP